MKHLMTTNPTKSRARRKPSQLLTSALALLGPRGQWWVKGTAKVTKGHIYFITGKKVKHDMLCSIGAIHEVNTPREDEASFYLAAAMGQLRPKHAAHLAYNHFTGKNYLDKEGPLQSSIPSFNDNPRTKWPAIKKAFKLAIRLAQNDGN